MSTHKNGDGTPINGTVDRGEEAGWNGATAADNKEPYERGRIIWERARQRGLECRQRMAEVTAAKAPWGGE
jgi:hypothetical protein